MFNKLIKYDNDTYLQERNLTWNQVRKQQRLVIRTALHWQSPDEYEIIWASKKNRDTGSRWSCEEDWISQHTQLQNSLLMGTAKQGVYTAYE